jgi:hypothetical protein
MDRRRFLAAAAAAGSLPFAGCSDRQGSDSRAATATDTPSAGDAATTPTADRSRSPATTPEPESFAELGFPSTICEAEAVPDFYIRAIDEPAFADDWTGRGIDDDYRIGSRAPPADGTPDREETSDPTGRPREASDAGTVDPDAPLAADAVVVGLTAGDRARAYPLPVLWWHEAVNDEFGGPVLVTFCPICNSGLVADRLVGDDPATFDVSGQLWQPPGEYTAAAVADGTAFGAATTDPAAAVRNSGNLVLVDDATGSFWSQVLGRAICGPREGDRLTVRPSTVTTWGAWRAAHPETDVLLPPPHSTLV